MNNFSVDNLVAIFNKINLNLASGKPSITLSWHHATLEEVCLYANLSLANLYPLCTTYKATKLAGAYLYWIAKLKPCLNLTTINLALNESVAIHTANAIIQERTNKIINLDRKQFILACETLRYSNISIQAIIAILDTSIKSID